MAEVNVYRSSSSGNKDWWVAAVRTSAGHQLVKVLRDPQWDRTDEHIVAALNGALPGVRNLERIPTVTEVGRRFRGEL